MSSTDMSQISALSTSPSAVVQQCHPRGAASFGYTSWRVIDESGSRLYAYQSASTFPRPAVSRAVVRGPVSLTVVMTVFRQGRCACPGVGLCWVVLVGKVGLSRGRQCRFWFDHYPFVGSLPEIAETLLESSKRKAARKLEHSLDLATAVGAIDVG